MIYVSLMKGDEIVNNVFMGRGNTLVDHEYFKAKFRRLSKFFFEGVTKYDFDTVLVLIKKNGKTIFQSKKISP